MKTTIHDSWSVSAEDYPSNGPIQDQWKHLLRYAILAPSNHNTQPWLFEIRHTMVDLYADRRRACPAVDPGDRELIMSCGCALFHLICAMRNYRCLGGVDYLPDRNPDLLARVHFGNWETESEEGNRILFEAITKRRTNRQPFLDAPLPEPLLQALREAAQAEGAWLTVVDSEKTRSDVAGLIARGDYIQWSHDGFRKEWSKWLRTGELMDHEDGIPGYAVGVDDLLSNVDRSGLRTFNMGAGEAARDQEIALGSPALVVLGTDGDKVQDWISAGRALSRVLLRARADNVWASFLNQPVEVTQLRKPLADRIGASGCPQAVLRLGYGISVRPTPRRPLESVLI